MSTEFMQGPRAPGGPRQAANGWVRVGQSLVNLSFAYEVVCFPGGANSAVWHVNAYFYSGEERELYRGDEAGAKGALDMLTRWLRASELLR